MCLNPIALSSVSEFGTIGAAQPAASLGQCITQWSMISYCLAEKALEGKRMMGSFCLYCLGQEKISHFQNCLTSLLRDQRIQRNHGRNFEVFFVRFLHIMIWGKGQGNPCTFFFLRFHLFTCKRRGREGEREGEKHQYVRDISIGCLLHTPNWGPGPQSRHVPQLGIKSATFRFEG